MEPGFWGSLHSPPRGHSRDWPAAWEEDPERLCGLCPLGLSFSPWTAGAPLPPPPPSPLPCPTPAHCGGCREDSEPGPRGKDETTRCVMVVTLVTGRVSRSAPGDREGLWGGGQGRGAFHHLGRRLPVRDSLHLAMMNGRSSAWKAWERSQRSRAEALRCGGEGGTAPGGPLVCLSRPLSSALEREQGRRGWSTGWGRF